MESTMNCTKIIPPSQNFITFFYYYSYFTLFITLAITPLQFYVIITQSKALKRFKWLILNHTFWSLLFEILFTTVKPLFLSPLISGFPLGLLKNGNLKLTALACLGIYSIAGISVAALGATLLCRYLHVFPATKWINKKYEIVIPSSLFFLIFFFFCHLFIPTIIADPLEVYQMAFEYDPCMQHFYKNEPGFIYISREQSAKTFYLGFGVTLCGNFLAIFLASFFIYLVKTNIDAKKSVLSHSLMMSAIIQLSLLTFFYLIPFSAFFGILAFAIPNTQNLMIALFCLIVTHTFLEFVATLYFVSPYRKAVTKLLHQFFCFKPLMNQSRQVSIAFVVNR